MLPNLDTSWLFFKFNFKKKCGLSSSRHIHEDMSSIPGLTQQIKDLVFLQGAA